MFDGVSDITPQELHELIKAKSKLKLIDVRQPEEYTGELGHIENAELIILNQLPEKYQALKPSDEIVVICRSGGRSAQAASFLMSQGFQKVYNMKGGMLLWNELGFPVS